MIGPEIQEDDPNQSQGLNPNHPPLKTGYNNSFQNNFRKIIEKEAEER